jgi:hypothetical protein
MNALHSRMRALWLLVALVPGAGPLAADPPARWAMPEARRTVVLKKTLVIRAGEVADFNYTRFVPHKKLGDGSQRENQKAVIRLLPGAGLRRVIIGAPGADGIHCLGRNRLSDVWFEDVGEDAVTVLGPDVRWIGGGARGAADKIVQMNHRGPFRGENLWFEDFITAVRGNGNPEFAKTPFEIHLRDISAKDGRTLVKLTSSGARAHLGQVNVRNLGAVGLAEGGARIEAGKINQLR